MSVIYTTVYRLFVIHPELEKLKTEAHQLRNHLAILLSDRRLRLGELVQEAFPDRKISHPVLIEGFWACPDDGGDGRQGPPQSPTGKCIYVAGEGEDCIFCGLPQERK